MMAPDINDSAKLTLMTLTDETTFVLPTSVAQKGFWYLDQLDPGNPAYNIALRFSLKGTLDRRALARAFEEVCRRHEVLRTTFATVDGEPRQIVSPPTAPEIAFVDLSQLEAPGRLLRAEEITIEEGRRSFNLAAGPLLRVMLVRLEMDEHLLLITVHHIVADGWSTGILISEIGSLYGDFHRGRSSTLPELPLQYGDFAIWEEQCLHEDGLADQIAFWKRTLKGHPSSAVPTDRPRPKVATSSGGMDTILLPRELTDRLSALANREGVTLFMLCLAALKVLLHRLTGETDLCVGSPVVGRSRVELEPLMGVFINSVALRTDLSGDPPFSVLLSRVRSTTLDALANQDVPFEQVVEAVRPRREPDRHPIFQVNLIHQRAFLKPLEVEGLSIRALPSISPGALYDLNFIMIERAEGWRATCEYNTDLFEAETVRRNLRHFQAILEGVAFDASRALSLLPGIWQSPATPTISSPSLVIAPSTPPPMDELSSTVTTPVLGEALVHENPEGKVELKLIQIWQDLLGDVHVGLGDDFFELGGHSMLAARLLARIEKGFGVRIPVLAFVKDPTIRALAAKVRSTAERPWQDQVIHFRSDGSKPPLIIINPFHRYFEVVKHLGTEQPVVGVASPPASEMPAQFSVELLAEHILEVLLKVQPHGPYYLAGWCDTGVVAYEIAQRLRSRGEEIGLLVLIDSWNPTLRRRLKSLLGLPTRAAIYLHKIRWHLGRIHSKGFRRAFDYLKDRLTSSRERRAQSKSNVGGAGFAIEEHAGEPILVGHLLADSYRPRPFDSKILLVTTKPLGDCGPIRRQGWEVVARGGLEVRHMECEHLDVFSEPNVRELAQILIESIPAPSCASGSDDVSVLSLASVPSRFHEQAIA